MPLLEQFYATNVFRADVSDPNDLLVVAATWPEEWRDRFDEREAIMAIGASAATGCWRLRASRRSSSSSDS
ncbi:MAG: hypothetical protein V3T84_04130 [Phycisphaerales bacterium]